MKRVIIIVCVLLLAGAGTFMFFESSFFTIATIDIKGDSIINQDDVCAYAGITRESNLVLVDIGYAEEALEMHPLIKKATVEKHYPDGISITYDVRNPVLAISFAGTYIIADDEQYALSVENDAMGLMTIYGMSIETFNLGKSIKMNDSGRLEAIVDLVKLVEISNLNFSPSIHILGEDIVLRIREDYHVNFGDGRNIEDRFTAFINIYRNLEEQQVSKGIIDVSTDGLPTFKPFGE